MARAARPATGDLRIVFSEILETFAGEGGHPGLDVGRRQVAGDVRADADFDAQPPQTGEVGFTIAGFGNGSGEVGFTVGCTRDSRRGMIEPLRLEDRGRRDHKC